MGGGLMQLVAMGAQDVYLTGNPQITFFKVVYRRHTNFSKECIAQTFSGTVPSTTEGSVTCTLARNGDLVQEIYLQTTVEANPSDSEVNSAGVVTIGSNANELTITAATGKATLLAATKKIYFGTDIYHYANSAGAPGNGEKIISKNTLYTIATRAASGLDVTVTLTNVTFNNAGTGAGVGPTNGAIAAVSTSINVENEELNNNDMTDLIKTVEVEIGGQKIDKHYSQWLDIYNELFETSHDLRFAMCNGSQSAPNDNTKTHYIPLRFWFNRNPGLALPLIALQYHEVKINMTLNPVRTVGATGAVTMSDAKLLVNYLYLDTDERRRFAQVSHEYLIEQVQHTGVESAGPITMNFNHPVKALFWTASANPDKVKLQLNGHDRAAEQPHDYYHLVQPYESGLGHSGKSLNNSTRTWGTVVNSADTHCVGMYSFCLKPAEHQPSGTCNFSRIDNARLNVETVSGLYLFAMNYNVLRIMSGMGGLAYSN